MSTTTESSLIPRLSRSRGHADHDWLKTFHTFAFASYLTRTPREHQWGPLRVLNEDRVAPAQGFPLHPHSEFEIFSYIVDGTIKHTDNMRNVENLSQGDIQMTSAGTGIQHSEGNASKSEPLHFLQIWAKPNVPRLKPSYYTRHFSRESKLGNLLKVVAPVKDEGVSQARENSTEPAPVHADLTMYASILPPDATVQHTFEQKLRKGYVHLIMTSGYKSPRDEDGYVENGAKVEITVSGHEPVVLKEGDGLYIDNINANTAGQAVLFKNVGAKEAEFVFFDLAN